MHHWLQGCYSWEELSLGTNYWANCIIHIQCYSVFPPPAHSAEMSIKFQRTTCLLEDGGMINSGREHFLMGQAQSPCDCYV